MNKFLLSVMALVSINCYGGDSYTVNRCLSEESAKSCSSCTKQDSSFKFKVNVPNQKVIKILDDSSSAFDQCTVVDEHNWICTVSIDKLNWLLVQSAMNDGKYYYLAYKRDGSLSYAYCGKKSLF